MNISFSKNAQPITPHPRPYSNKVKFASTSDSNFEKMKFQDRAKYGASIGASVGVLWSLAGKGRSLGKTIGSGLTQALLTVGAIEAYGFLKDLTVPKNKLNDIKNIIFPNNQEKSEEVNPIEAKVEASALDTKYEKSKLDSTLDSFNEFVNKV